MKAKLLKKLRKDHKFKFRKGWWFVLRDGYYKTTYSSFESALEDILEYKCTYYSSLFDWYWVRIQHNYMVKVNTRKFNKL